MGSNENSWFLKRKNPFFFLFFFRNECHLKEGKSPKGNNRILFKQFQATSNANQHNALTALSCIVLAELHYTKFLKEANKEHNMQKKKNFIKTLFKYQGSLTA